MRRPTTLRLRNNLLNVVLFEQSSQSLDTTETASTIDPIEPVAMAQNDEGMQGNALVTTLGPSFRELSLEFIKWRDKFYNWFPCYEYASYLPW